MNMAAKIHRELKKEVDLKLIKKIIGVYEKLKNEDDEELMSFEDAQTHLQGLIGDITPADSVRIYREREEITQNELSLKSGIRQQHISEIERGLRPIGVATAKKLAKALNCNYKSLL